MSDEQGQAAPSDVGQPAQASTEQLPASQPAEQQPSEQKAPISPFYSTLPEDWREQLISGGGYEGDEAEKTRNLLARHKDMPSLVKALRESQKKISSGQAKAPLPENPTPEDLASYREANGIPAEYTGYQIELSDGVEIIDSDKMTIDALLKEAHANNIKGDAVNKMINAMLKQRENEFSERQMKDKLESQKAADALKQQWGPDFERNKNITLNLLKSELSPDDFDAFINARTSGGDGGGVFNNPAIVNMFAKIARAMAPAPTVVPPGNAGRNHEQIVAGYKEKMKEDGWDKSQDKRDYIAYLESYERNKKRM